MTLETDRLDDSPSFIIPLGKDVGGSGRQDSVWDNHTRAWPLQLLYRSPLIAVSTLDAREWCRGRLDPDKYIYVCVCVTEFQLFPKALSRKIVSENSSIKTHYFFVQYTTPAFLQHILTRRCQTVLHFYEVWNLNCLFKMFHIIF